jgi:hypothetical protein
MSKTRDTGYLANVIQVHDTGVRIMSGSEMLMEISSSGAVTITGELSGSDAANALLLSGTGSVGFTTTGSFTTMSSSLSSRATQIESVYATTGSNSFRATQSITGSLTVTGQIIAQTLNVQQVTSSIVYSSGSNVFGCDINSRQTFTGSFYQTGSIASFSTCVGIGTLTPTSGKLEIQTNATTPALWVQTGGTTTCYCIASFRTGTNAAALEIYGNGVSTFGNNICVLSNSNTFGNASASGRALILQAGSGNQAIQFKNCWGGDGTLYACGNATALHYVFNTYSCSDVLFIANGGNVGFGCNNPSYTIDVNGNAHFRSDGGTVLIESTQPTNASTLKIIQCSTGGNGNADQGLVVQTNAGDGTSNIANFYDYNNGSPVSRVRIRRSGIVSIGNNTCVDGVLTASSVCSISYTFGGSIICASQVRIGNHGFNTGYEGDGIWGTNATPSFIRGTGYNGGFYLGYRDNGSGLYGAAYGFDVSYRDGNNTPQDYDAVVMRNSGQGTRPFRVTSYGNIYGNTKNFRIKHPIPSMNDTHYLVHTSIEGPQADLIYRGKVQLANGKAEVNIDLASKMTDGTFELLCQDVQSYTTNESGWSLTKSYVVENILHIEAQDETANDIISWLVIGERNDDGIKNSAITDENGHVIVEELKPEEGL